MRIDPQQRTTRIDDENGEVLYNYSSTTRDTLILVREASHRMSVDGLRQIEMVQIGNDYRIEVRARR